MEPYLSLFSLFLLPYKQASSSNSSIIVAHNPLLNETLSKFPVGIAVIVMESDFTTAFALRMIAFHLMS